MELDKYSFAVSVSETRAAYMTKEEAWEDRKAFVHNLGVLLNQTREHFDSAYLDDEDVVHIVFDHDYEVKVNVNMDSYKSIIRDVMKHI